MPRTSLSIPKLSLLYPEKPQKNHSNEHSEDAWVNDLGLESVIRGITTDRRYLLFIRQVFTNMTNDPAVILWRQSLFADFMHNPLLVTQVESVLPRLATLRQGTTLLGKHKRSLLLETSDRLAELDIYTEVVEILHSALQSATLESQPLKTLRDSLAVLLNDENFQKLREELPALRAPMENIASLTIGVNLDLQLQPSSAVLLAINDYKIDEAASFLDRLIGTRSDAVQESGIAPLHQMTTDPELRFLMPLFQDLDRLLKDVASPVAHALNRYVRLSSDTLFELENEFAFYVLSVRMMQKLQAQGVLLCHPEVMVSEEAMANVEGLMNIHLLLSQQNSSKVVASDVQFDDSGRIAILTGPNSGGKTTYLQSVGLAYVLFQAGLYIPAKSAQMSVIDHILTHFPRLETRERGRLEEEAERLRLIFKHITSQSLVLLNETFSSTASGEAVYLAQDILGALRSIGVRAIYATHLVELVEHLDEIESLVEGRSKIYSLVAGVHLTQEGEAAPTFEVKRGLPLGRSFAQEIARRHGISLGQILELKQTKEV